jgi:hypothetical protein
MPNTFNKDFRRALDAKLALRGAQTRGQEAEAALNLGRANVLEADTRSAIDLRGSEANLNQTRAGLLGRETESLANLRDQDARARRIGANIALGEGLEAYAPEFAQSARVDLERGGIDSPAFSNPQANSFGDNVYASEYDPSLTDAYGNKRGGFRSFSNYANGGAVSIGGADSGFTADYELYRQAANNAGVPALSVREAIPMMAQLRENRRKQVLDLIARGGTTPQGYARGGEIDGPGTGKSDSIPAVVDGVAPAAVSDGEFHIPKHVVDYYGTKMLDGLVEKARMAMKAAQRKQGAGYAQGGAVKKPPAETGEEEPLRFALTKEEIAANNAPLTADDLKNMEAGKRARARFDANAAKPLPEGYALEGFSGKTYGDLYNYLQSGPGVVEYLQTAYGVGPEPTPTVVAAR